MRHALAILDFHSAVSRILHAKPDRKTTTMRFYRYSRLLLVPSVAAAWVSPPLRSSFSRLAPLHSVKVLGVCGGIGSGKSQACKTLVEDLSCWAHLDTDSIAHKVYEPNSQAVVDIANEFGSEILTEDGQVDRKQLGAIVFGSPESMSKLERIVWPHVKTEIETIVDSYREKSVPDGKKPVIVLEAAVLVDAGWQDLLDGLWVVRVPPEQALERLQSQRGFSADDAQQRIDAQQSRRGIGNLQEEVDNGVVSCVVTNDGTLDDLTKRLSDAMGDTSCWYS